MTSVVVLKKEVQQIQKHVDPEKTGLVWSYGNDRYGCDGREFFSDKQLREYQKRMGYTRMVILTWER